MYRCASAAVAALVVSFSAHAQVQRNFPANALRGTVTFGEVPDVVLNASPARLGAGVRIRDQGNLQPRPATLVGQTAVVNYTLDTQGLIKDVWILRPEEAARKPWPTTAEEARTWQFDPVAQTWTRP
jgi:hypothetical protein